jgi:hypothetical protein
MPAAISHKSCEEQPDAAAEIKQSGDQYRRRIAEQLLRKRRAGAKQ